MSAKSKVLVSTITASVLFFTGVKVKEGYTAYPVIPVVSKREVVFKKTLTGVKLSQTEYDSYLDFSYQFGTPA